MLLFLPSFALHWLNEEDCCCCCCSWRFEEDLVFRFMSFNCFFPSSPIRWCLFYSSKEGKGLTTTVIWDEFTRETERRRETGFYRRQSKICMPVTRNLSLSFVFTRDRKSFSSQNFSMIWDWKEKMEEGAWQNALTCKQYYWERLKDTYTSPLKKAMEKRKKRERERKWVKKRMFTLDTEFIRFRSWFSSPRLFPILLLSRFCFWSCLYCFYLRCFLFSRLILQRIQGYLFQSILVLTLFFSHWLEWPKRRWKTEERKGSSRLPLHQ